MKGVVRVWACRVRELREQDRGSLRYVAAPAGISVTELRRIEAGADPRLSSALSLAKVFEVPVGELWSPVPNAEAA